MNRRVVEPVHDEENPYRPAFKEDEEALRRWGAIIDSIRLLPGS